MSSGPHIEEIFFVIRVDFKNPGPEMGIFIEDKHGRPIKTKDMTYDIRWIPNAHSDILPELHREVMRSLAIRFEDYNARRAVLYARNFLFDRTHPRRCPAQPHSPTEYGYEYARLETVYNVFPHLASGGCVNMTPVLFGRAKAAAVAEGES